MTAQTVLTSCVLFGHCGQAATIYRVKFHLVRPGLGPVLWPAAAGVFCGRSARAGRHPETEFRHEREHTVHRRVGGRIDASFPTNRNPIV